MTTTQPTNESKAMNTELLNKVKDMVIGIANKSGRRLQDDFGTPEKFKDFIVSLTIKGLVDHCGMEIDAAFDIVMGDGEFKRLCDDCWETLNGAAA